ncbi:type II toxin-antitoxin system VapC family toxin [Iamia sp.]|uniref:type II toxin-antitoxin system VapC family toxin n=1 Tax=Iamia sp. TaxID=2722710 RepID=UPI002BF60E86|nr:type II toxin-antitoxin system VapC family toxin [Iamia sp.]HXH59056.1 type II toxin-antitoxin system VapC family toxin [Iamia sp.]
MILLDSNIPMYLVGADHPHKADAQRLLDDAISRDERLVTDAEALQEILHRYGAIGRLDAIQPAFDALLGVVDEVLPVGLTEIEKAKRIVLGGYGLSARDALHLAVMETAGIDRLMSFDRGFDRYPGIDRLS